MSIPFRTGTEAWLALAASFFGGMFVTALVLWFHEGARLSAV